MPVEFIYRNHPGRAYKYLFIVCPRIGFNGFGVMHGERPCQIPSSQHSV